MSDANDDRPGRRGSFGTLLRLAILVPSVAIAAYLGYLVIALGPNLSSLDLEALVRGYHRILEPAAARGAPLRTSQGGADRFYLLTTQVERIVPVRPLLSRRSMSAARRRDILHVDLWAFDPATARPAWRQRLRSFEDRQALTFELLGADGETLWLFVREPIGVSLRDGRIVADGAIIEQHNPALAGLRVDQTGFVAFGAQGLQLTLSDSTQWAIDGERFAAQARATAPRGERIAAPAYRASYTHSLQMRGLPLGDRWLGVLTDAEADTLRKPPVVPGSKPGDRRGAMAEFLESQHVPGDLDVQPQRYRLWSARLAKVSAAPRGWPKELPDNWGTRDAFSDYQPLPEAPHFLQAGLLGDGRSESPMWYREPDSVVVLHHDKLGDAGRLRLARVAGPGGRVVWDAALPLAELTSATYGPGQIVLFGTVPNPAHNPDSAESREQHEVLVAVDVPTGTVSSFDLTANLGELGG